MINGILNIKKEAGYTSHDVVAKLRGILRQKKIGHTGTLDPDATGVLPVCLGRATRLCDLIGGWDKTYEAVLLLGKTTDTEDISGAVLSEASVSLSEGEIIKIIQSFEGEYQQVPPMYSAKKVGGKKLYEMARAGIVIERKACPVKIHKIKILKAALPRVTFQVTCSKGTYIRSLCRDIGEKAGCGGCMEKLIRTRVAEFDIGEAYTLSDIEKMRDENMLRPAIKSIDSVFEKYPSLVVTGPAEKLLMNGNPIKKHSLPQTETLKREGLIRVYNSGYHFIGLYQTEESSDQIRPHKLFFDITDVPGEKHGIYK